MDPHCPLWPVVEIPKTQLGICASGDWSAQELYHPLFRWRLGCMDRQLTPWRDSFLCVVPSHCGFVPPQGFLSFQDRMPMAIVLEFYLFYYRLEIFL